MLGKVLIAAVALASGTPATGDTLFRVIKHFPGGVGGMQPEAGVIVDPSDGRSLYGTTDRGGGADAGVIFKLTPPATADGAWTRRILYDFSGGAGGGYPLQLLPDGAGGLFGYTLDGGTAGYGTVFQATPKPNPAARWNAVQLHSFMAGSDGAYPSGLARYGRRLVGVTDQGGAGPCTDPGGELTHCGTVYELIPPPAAGGAWTEKVIYAFTGGSDGATPNGHLLIRGGTLVGTTTRGGDGPCTYNSVRIGCGVLYELIPPATPGGSWTQQVLFSFPGGADGAVPVDGVILGRGGYFGVTSGGGNKDAGGSDLGTVYQMTKTDTGWQHSVIYRFTDRLDGYLPLGGLYYDAAKKVLYGTTYLGGTSRGNGTVFRLDRSPNGAWSKTILHSFSGGDGSYPTSALVADGTGALYGTTPWGSSGGTVYQISFTP